MSEQPQQLFIIIDDCEEYETQNREIRKRIKNFIKDSKPGPVKGTCWLDLSKFEEWEQYRIWGMQDVLTTNQPFYAPENHALIRKKNWKSF